MTLRSAETLELLAFPKLVLVHVRTGREGSPWTMAVNASGSASNRRNIVFKATTSPPLNALSFSGRMRVIVSTLFSTG